MAKAEPYRWSVPLGTWWGIPVRAHILLVLFAVLTVAVGMQDMAPEAVIAVLVLVVSVALHETAHAVSAIRMGGEVDQIVLGPVGGLAFPRVPDEPEPQVFVALAGPITNLGLVVACTATLIAAGEREIIWLFNPFAPKSVLEGTLPIVTVKLTLLVNLVLFLINLLPAWPFDMAPAMRAMLWPALGKRSAAEATGQIARVIAVVIALAAAFVSKQEPQSVLPIWAPLVTLGVFLLFSAHKDLICARSGDWGVSKRSNPSWADDSSDPMVLVEQSAEGSGRRADADSVGDEATEDARVDDILARLHVAGYDELSSEERAVLERASRRYRGRRRPG